MSSHRFVKSTFFTALFCASLVLASRTAVAGEYSTVDQQQVPIGYDLRTAKEAERTGSDPDYIALTETGPTGNYQPHAKSAFDNREEVPIANDLRTSHESDRTGSEPDYAVRVESGSIGYYQPHAENVFDREDDIPIATDLRSSHESDRTGADEK